LCSYVIGTRNGDSGFDSADFLAVLMGTQMSQKMIGPKRVTNCIYFAILSKQLLDGGNAFSDRLDSRVVNDLKVADVAFKFRPHRIDQN